MSVCVRRPGDAALPSLYAPMGTQVGTPAWIPESVEDQVDVAKIWFVIIKRSSEKSAVSRAADNGTPADKDADKHKGQAASSSEQPTVVMGAPGQTSSCVAWSCSKRDLLFWGLYQLWCWFDGLGSHQRVPSQHLIPCTETVRLMLTCCKTRPSTTVSPLVT